MEDERITHPDIAAPTVSILPPPAAYQSHHNYHEEDGAGVWRSIRSIPPADFTLHITTFTCLPKIHENKYESIFFKSGGYKWQLHLHPKGDTAKGGSGYISLYLAIAEASDLPLDWEVNVNFKLFIHDQLRDTYLTIQDLHGRVRRFNSLRMEHGFPKLIALEDFHNPSKGYLVDDKCTFGAEVHVMPRNTRRRMLDSIAYYPPDQGPHLSWALKDFSKKGSGCYSSDVIVAAHRKWKFHVYPKGERLHKGKLSLYLELIDHDGGGLASRFNFMQKLFPKNEGSLHVRLDIRVKDQAIGTHHVVRKYNLWAPSGSRYSGQGNFMLLSDLVSRSERFLVNDTLIVEAIFTLIIDHKRI